MRSAVEDGACLTTSCGDLTPTILSFSFCIRASLAGSFDGIMALVMIVARLATLPCT